MALAGVFSNYYSITKDSLIKIRENIVSETGKLMDSTNHFEKTLTDCYFKDREDKTGFNRIEKILTNEDNNRVNKYIDIIKENCRNKDNKNTETYIDNKMEDIAPNSDFEDLFDVNDNRFLASQDMINEIKGL